MYTLKASSCGTKFRLRDLPQRMGFAGAIPTLDIICAADEASRSGAGRRLTQEGAQACVGWRRRASAGCGVAAHQLAPAGPMVAQTAANALQSYVLPIWEITAKVLRAGFGYVTQLNESFSTVY